MASKKKFKVLVVDDESEILEIVSEEFEEAGLATDSAKTSQEAINKIKENIKTKETGTREILVLFSIFQLEFFGENFFGDDAIISIWYWNAKGIEDNCRCIFN